MFFFSPWWEKKQKNQGCQKISSKLRFCFFPRNRNSSFQKNLILILRFLSTSYPAQNRTLFCVKIFWRPFFTSIKKIFLFVMLILNSNFCIYLSFLNSLSDTHSDLPGCFAKILIKIFIHTCPVLAILPGLPAFIEYLAFIFYEMLYFFKLLFF